MNTSSQNNKRIAKNTLLLYVRMLFMVIIGLYTSRVVLNTLGIEDFGINNVVGGVITMLSFLTGSLGAASSRFITYNLGIGDKSLMNRTFGNIVTIHLILALVVLVIGETIGLWFVVNKLQIPELRQTAALVVYQFSIFTMMLGVVSVPYNAAIIAHEKMSAFAYVTIIDALLKLAIVYILVIVPIDKLIMYAFLLFLVQLFDRIVYGVYCTRHFEETRVKLSFEKEQFKEIFSYAMWTMNGSLAVFGYTQGINILLNLFFGPAVNAARGVAIQVQDVVMRFCSNFQMALNPQLTKSYAQHELQNMHKLLKLSSKFSFYLLLLLSLPLMFEAPLVLKWWLGKFPEYSVSFLRLILWASIIVALSNPVIVAVHATGRIKKFQMIEGTMLLSIVPIAYLLLKIWNIRPEYVFCVHIVVELITQYARIKIVLPMISMSTKEYFLEVVTPIIKVCIISVLPTFLVFYSLEQNIMSFFAVCTTSTLCVIGTTYFIGCTRSERIKLVEYSKSIISKFKVTK